MRASIRLSASDLHPSSHNILETLSYEEELPVTHLAALLWIISIFLMLGEAYSTWGRTKVLYASSFTFELLVFTSRLTNPSVPFALAVIELICSFQLRSLESVASRYLVSSLDTKAMVQRYTF